MSSILIFYQVICGFMRVFRLLTVSIPSFSSDDFLLFFPIGQPRSLHLCHYCQLQFHTYFIVRKTACFQTLPFLLLNFNSFSPQTVNIRGQKGKNKTLKKKQTQTHPRFVPYNNVTKRFFSFAIETKKINTSGFQHITCYYYTIYRRYYIIRD